MKGIAMKNLKLVAVIFLLSTFISSTFGGDKEDVQAALDKTIESFNKQDYKTYFSAFADDNTAFTTVGSPLRFDAKAWKEFIEGTSQLQYVNYYQQDNIIRIYNGDTAVITGYYKFKTMPKGGELNTQNGRASMVLVKQDGKWMTVHMHFSKIF
jgi:uncharacterized protein (TIGR02246 family)